MNKGLQIQIQPDLVLGLDLEAIRSVARDLKAVPGVASLEEEDGDDNGHYLNFLYRTTNLHALWSAIRASLLNDADIGEAATKASIIVCEGEDAWNDYLLLHHFDPSEPTDAL